MTSVVRPLSVLALCFCLYATDPARSPLPLRAPLQDKNFYLLSLMERSDAVRDAVDSDPALHKLAVDMRARMRDAAKCGVQVDCYTTSLTWKPAEITAAAAALRSLCTTNQVVGGMVDGPLRSSGVFQVHAAMNNPDLLAQTWTDAAAALNNIIAVYGAGKPARYAAIDSISYDIKAPGYPNLLRTMLAVMDEDSAHLDLFFQPSLRFALVLLDANHRDEAARYEPLEAGENAAALRALKSIAWNRYPYSVIIVPGYGPDRLGWNLAAMGKLRLEMAVRRYRDRKAPLILVSGGHAHPAQTPYAEAIEMKKSLMADFGVPASAILVEPYARHTTTNLRNAARQIYRYGIPFDQKTLIVTDEEQSRGIESQAFEQRCIREMGMMPGKIGARTSKFDLEFLPLLVSLHVDAMDPLDP